MKPAGADVRLTYQTPEVVEPGEAIVVARTGRTYLVTEARRMRSRRPGPPCWAIRAIVAAATPEPGVRCHPLVWWPRSRRRPR